jgi:hypothetical protein
MLKWSSCWALVSVLLLECRKSGACSYKLPPKPLMPNERYATCHFIVCENIMTVEKTDQIFQNREITIGLHCIHIAQTKYPLPLPGLFSLLTPLLTYRTYNLENQPPTPTRRTASAPATITYILQTLPLYNCLIVTKNHGRPAAAMLLQSMHALYSYNAALLLFAKATSRCWSGQQQVAFTDDGLTTGDTLTRTKPTANCYLARARARDIEYRYIDCTHRLDQASARYSSVVGHG